MGTRRSRGRSEVSARLTSASGESRDIVRRVLFGRRQGKRLRPGRKSLLTSLLPQLAVSLPTTGFLDPTTCFDRQVREVWLEIGFGGGEHLAAQARANPQVGIIGCEPFINGVAALLTAIERDPLNNVRVFADDGRILLDVIENATIGRMFLLFPDPWPKKRHHKRRFVTTANLDHCARVLRPGAELRVATDDGEYCDWILQRFISHGSFRWEARGPKDWRERPLDWPETRYELKAWAAGRRPVFLRFRRTG